MHKAARLISLSLIAAVLVFILCACTTLSGRYEAAKGLGVATSYTFSGDI